MKELEGTLRARIEALLGGRITSARPAPGGYSQAQRWIVGTDNLVLFAKIGTPPIADVSLRHEASVYEQVDLPCMPRVLGWEDDGSLPILLLEDLSAGHWPPPWTPDSITQLLGTIDECHRANAPLQTFEAVHGTRDGWWLRLAADPSAFLDLGVVDGPWLRKSLTVLIEAESGVDPRGSAVTHFDLRSDNVCFLGADTRIIDWSMACLGNPKLDLGFFLPIYPPALIGTFPSTYQLLPRARHKLVVWDDDLDKPITDLLDPALWERLGWGLAAPDQGTLLAELMPDVADPAERRRRALRKARRRQQQANEALVG